jgi:hypothetical protein
MPYRRPLVPRAELPRLAAALHAGGLTWAQVGGQFGVHAATACRAGREGLEQLRAEVALMESPPDWWWPLAARL